MSWTTDLLTAVAVRLADAGVATWKPAGTYTSGETAITLGRLPTAPDRAVALAAYGADGADDPVNTDGTQGLQLRFRGTTDPRTVDDLADAAFDVLHGWQQPAVGVLLCTRRISAPMGIDGSQRWERADSYYLLIHRPSSNRPG